jgi:hypothetical protein
MAELTPGQDEVEGGGRMVELPPVNWPWWASEQLVISREWVAFREGRRAPWNVIPYAAVSSFRRGDFGRIVLTGPDDLAVVLSTAALDSLEACELLANGLGTNPVVAPAAAELLEPWLAAARVSRDSEVKRRHKVDPSGTVHTFYSMRVFHLVAGIVVALLGVGGLVGDAAALAFPSSSWARGSGGLSTWDDIWLAALCLLMIWFGIRMVRVGTSISSEKITVRGYVRTRTTDASEIRAVTLQTLNSDSGPRWIPRVELTSGKSFWIDSLDCGSARKPPTPGAAATIEQIQVLLGVAADGVSRPEDRQPGTASE